MVSRGPGCLQGSCASVPGESLPFSKHRPLIGKWGQQTGPLAGSSYTSKTPDTVLGTEPGLNKCELLLASRSSLTATWDGCCHHVCLFSFLVEEAESRRSCHLPGVARLARGRAGTRTQLDCKSELLSLQVVSGGRWPGDRHAALQKAAGWAAAGRPAVGRRGLPRANWLRGSPPACVSAVPREEGLRSLQADSWGAGCGSG